MKATKHVTHSKVVTWNSKDVCIYLKTTLLYSKSLNSSTPCTSCFVISLLFTRLHSDLSIYQHHYIKIKVVCRFFLTRPTFSLCLSGCDILTLFCRGEHVSIVGCFAEKSPIPTFCITGFAQMNQVHSQSPVLAHPQGSQITELKTTSSRNAIIVGIHFSPCSDVWCEHEHMHKQVFHLKCIECS